MDAGLMFFGTPGTPYGRTEPAAPEITPTEPARTETVLKDPIPNNKPVENAIPLNVKSNSNIPLLRSAYEAEVKGLSDLANKMRVEGHSVEEIARQLHSLRRELGVKYKSLTPDPLLQEIYARNIKKYGDKLGPSIDYLRQQGKSWEDIINSAIRPGGKDINLNK